MKNLIMVLIPLVSLAATHSCLAASADHGGSSFIKESSLHPIRTLPMVRGEGWKNADRFDSLVDGYRQVFSADEEVTVTVKGTSDLMEVDEANGFAVSAKLFDRTRKTGNRAEDIDTLTQVTHDAATRQWQVKLTAPQVTHDKYALIVSLYCKERDSSCAAIYGLGTQIDKILPLEVR